MDICVLLWWIVHYSLCYGSTTMSEPSAVNNLLNYSWLDCLNFDVKSFPFRCWKIVLRGYRDLEYIAKTNSPCSSHFIFPPLSLFKREKKGVCSRTHKIFWMEVFSLGHLLLYGLFIYIWSFYTRNPSRMDG